MAASLTPCSRFNRFSRLTRELIGNKENLSIRVNGRSNHYSTHTVTIGLQKRSEFLCAVYTMDGRLPDFFFSVGVLVDRVCYTPIHIPYIDRYFKYSPLIYILNKVHVLYLTCWTETIMLHNY
jgi:hypothetical protein